MAFCCPIAVAGRDCRCRRLLRESKKEFGVGPARERPPGRADSQLQFQMVAGTDAGHLPHETKEVSERTMARNMGTGFKCDI
jgi:hypothetical protein